MERFSRKFADYIVEDISKMSEEELNDGLKSLFELDQFNCWWVEYEMKDILTEIVRNQLKLIDDKNT